jgi:hypothetical protein
MTLLTSRWRRAARSSRAYAVWFAPAACAAACIGYAPRAEAYSTDSVLSDPCHERMTVKALQAVRRDLPQLARLPAPTRDEQALIEDLPFDLPPDLRDVAAATLVLGNRDVDVHGNEPNDLDQLALIHGNPDTQREHCLRRPEHDEPDGARLALSDCRAYIQERLQSASVAIGSDGLPDMSHRMDFEAVLQLRSDVVTSLPRFWVELGRALHTVQDGFSHTYRSLEDPRRVTTVLNYVEVVEETHDESRDGPPHSSGLDRCQDIDDLRRERLGLAVDASYDLMRALLDPAGGQAERLARADAVLARYLTLDESANCTAENGWCGAPERLYAEQRGCVCAAAGTSSAGGSTAPLAAGVAVAAGAAARRARRGRARRRLAGAAFLAVLLSGPIAAAQMDEPGTVPPASEPVAIDSDVATAPVVDATPDKQERDPFPFGVEIAGGGSALQNGAVAASLGLRYRIGRRFLVGLDGEFNPWFAMEDRELRMGSTNVYATGIVRFPLRFQRVNIRSTLELGISRMNFDLVGVPEGSVGPYVGFNLLGIDYELARSFYLVVDPAHVAIPIPQTTGVPFAYPQFRFTLGLQIGA